MEASETPTVTRFTARNVDNCNMSLFKNFNFTENMRIQLRFEGYNVFNHTQWGTIKTWACLPRRLEPLLWRERGSSGQITICARSPSSSNSAASSTSKLSLALQAGLTAEVSPATFSPGLHCELAKLCRVVSFTEDAVLPGVLHLLANYLCHGRRLYFAHYTHKNVG